MRPAGWRARAAAILLVGGIVAAAHAPVLRSQALSLDDEQFVVRNPLVTHPGWASTTRFFAEILAPSTVPGYSLPLTMTSLMLDWAAGGRPGHLQAFHRTNLVLHLVSVALLVLLLERLAGSLAAAAAVGLLFGLHPLTVEPLAWITERKTLLATCFGFASVLGYVEACRTGSRLARALSLVAFASASLAKPTVLTLPLLLLALDAWPLRRLSRRALIEKWPWAVLAVASAVISRISLARTMPAERVTALDPVAWAWQVAYTLGFDLGKMVWPGTLATVYEPPSPYTLANPLVLATVVAVVAFTVALVLVARRHPAPLAGWAFFAIALAPTFRPANGAWIVAADKYLYFPAPGVLVVLAAGLAWMLRRWPGAAPRAAVAALVAALALGEARAARAAYRNWSDSLTHFRHLVAVAPRTPVLRDALGSRLFEARQYDAAIAEYGAAVALAPDYAPARFDLGNALATVGRTEEAVGEFQAAARLEPNDGRMAFVLGLALDLAGRAAEARATMARALALAAAAGDTSLAREVRSALGPAPR